MSHIIFKDSERLDLWRERVAQVPSFMPSEYYRPSAETRGLNEGLYFDLQCYLPGDILVKVDRAAMAHGLETRAPFLDRDLVEFALSLPANLKVMDDQTKVLLKHACSEYWPSDVRSRNKQGFGAPYTVWLGLPEVQTLIAGVFGDGSELRRLLPGLRVKQRKWRTYQTWVLLTLGLWLQRHAVSA